MNIRTFSTKKEALDFIAKIDTGIYYLHHGEYERPSYKARKIRGREVYGVKAEYFFFPGTFNAKKDGYLTWEETYFID